MSDFRVRRRSFVRGAFAGTAVLTVPGFLAGCAEKQLTGTSATPAASPTASVPTNPFEAWFGLDEASIRKAMAVLTSRGADHADIYFQHTRSNSVRYQDGIIASATTHVVQGVGMRVVIGDQVGYAYTDELTQEALERTAKSAALFARGSARELPETFARSARPDRYALEVPWSQVGVDLKLPLIEQVATMAKASDPTIDKVNVSWSDSEERVLVATLDGRVVTDERPMTRLRVGLTAVKNGEKQSNSSNLAARAGLDFYTDERLAQVVSEARDRTLILFDARRPNAGEMPVVLAAGASGILLHEAIGHGMEADFNRKNTSIYSEMLGKKIAPDFVTIVDDGTLDNERGSLNVDDEGNEAQRTTLVEKGVLVSYLHDRISAKHYGVAPTGSGRRESYRHAPLPRMRATYMEDGPHSRDEIVQSVKNGIIAETFTNGQVQIGRRRLHLLHQERLAHRGRQDHRADQGHQHHRQRARSPAAGDHGRQRQQARHRRLDLRQGRPGRAGLAGPAHCLGLAHERGRRERCLTPCS